MDFDAYHPRLIADIIGYDLPAGSVHEYFARQYFGKQEISDKEYCVQFDDIQRRIRELEG